MLQTLSRRSFLAGAVVFPFGLAGCPLQVPASHEQIYRVVRRNDPSKGSIVFTHGVGESHEHMLPFSEGLASGVRGGYSTLAWDIPSDSIRIRQIADDLNSIIENEGMSPVLAVGNSYGGMASLQAAIDKPQNYRGLILISSGHRVASIDKILDGAQNLEDIAADMQRLSYAAQTLVPIERLTVPTLLYVAENDRYFPIEIANEAVERAGGIVRLRTISGAPHEVVRFQPQKVLAMLYNDVPGFFQEW